MPKLTFLLNDSTSREVDAEDGASVMRTAINDDVPGIVAECGGAAMCATCHVYVEEGAERLPAIEADEEEMLTFTVSPRQDNSRLSCQIRMTADLEGLVVQIPEAQN